jgi:hypothetical protein
VRIARRIILEYLTRMPQVYYSSLRGGVFGHIFSYCRAGERVPAAFGENIE